MAVPSKAVLRLAGLVIETVGGAFARTVIDTPEEVPVAPALSVARAVRECVPTDAPCQSMEYGAVVSEPISAPPSRKPTRVTEPSTSAAEAESAMVDPAANVAPLAGAVRVAVGGLF